MCARSRECPGRTKTGLRTAGKADSRLQARTLGPHVLAGKANSDTGHDRFMCLNVKVVTCTAGWDFPDSQEVWDVGRSKSPFSEIPL